MLIVPMRPFLLPLLLAACSLADTGPEADPSNDQWITATWLPLEITQGVMALQAELSLPGWIGVSASLGTDGKPLSKGAPLEAALELRYYFLRPFSGFDVGLLGGSVRSRQDEWIFQAAPVAGYKWISPNGFTVDGIGGWTWVWGDRQQAGSFLVSGGVGYTW